ncbi:MAG: AMP-binding protein, partial [Firmicutes bacterium]|nr:AMP-binding protein [Bacillota bacterium]
MNNILEYLEKTVKEVPDKTAFKGGGTEYTFRQLVDVSRSIDTVLAARDVRKKPVAVYMKKHPDMIVSFFGVLQAGAFYIPIDEEMPAHRIQYILESIAPEVVICDDSTLENAKKLCTRSEVLYFKDICGLPADDAAL